MFPVVNMEKKGSLKCPWILGVTKNAVSLKAVDNLHVLIKTDIFTVINN